MSHRDVPGGSGDEVETTIVTSADGSRRVAPSERAVVDVTAVTGEMPQVAVPPTIEPIDATDATADGLPAFNPGDFESPPITHVEFAIAQAALGTVPAVVISEDEPFGEPRITTPEEAAQILAPDREKGAAALEDIIEGLGGSLTPDTFALLIGVRQDELEAAGYMSLDSGEYPAFQHYRGAPLYGVTDVIETLRQAQHDVPTILSFFGAPSQHLGGRSPLQKLKVAHQMSAATGEASRAAVEAVCTHARNWHEQGYEDTV